MSVQMCYDAMRELLPAKCGGRTSRRIPVAPQWGTTCGWDSVAMRPARPSYIIDIIETKKKVGDKD